MIADYVVLAQVFAGLDLDDLQRVVRGFSMRCLVPWLTYADSFSCSRNTSSPRVTRAVPATTTQCSALWRCICSEMDAPGSIVSLLTWNPGPESRVSYVPQGRWTRRWLTCSVRPSFLSRSINPHLGGCAAKRQIPISPILGETDLSETELCS